MAPNRCTTLSTRFLPLVLTFVVALPLYSQQDALPDPQKDVQATPQPAPVVDTPAASKAPIRTARLAFLSGDVQIQRSDNTAPDPGADTAALNMPLSEGTRLVTGDSSQAEVEFEDGSVARLAQRSSLAIDSLGLDGKSDEKSVADTQLTLLSGLAYFELRNAPTSLYSINAGSVTAQPQANAVLRIAVDQSSATVSVLAGTLAVSAADGFTATVNPGQSLCPDPDDPTRYFLNQQIAEESSDSWNVARDEAASTDSGTRTAARDAYAGPQGYGWSDLDANGSWYNVPGIDGDQTEIWQPAVAAYDSTDTSTDTTDTSDSSFDPYGDGAFTWSGGGYVWASSYSWGWLPYRCGRWNWYSGFGWGWSPNHSCGTWGFGTGGILVGRKPLHYKLVTLPLHGPGPIRPIHRQPNLPHPARAHADDARAVRIAGIIATPLPHLSAAAVPGALVAGPALYRDYPVESKTRKPILGTLPEPPNPLSDQRLDPLSQPPAVGWIAHQSAPGVTPLGTAPTRTTPLPTGAPVLRPTTPPPAPAHSAPPPPHPAPAEPTPAKTR
jgi:hypothetical protein